MYDYIGRISLIHGWLPVALPLISAVVLVSAIGWRSRRWRVMWLPAMTVGGVVLAVSARIYLGSQGIPGDPAPTMLWIWIAATGLAVGVVVFGWRSARWLRRGLGALAVPLCVGSAALTANLWVGYFPTVDTAWGQLAAGKLPDQIDLGAMDAMQRAGVRPAKGVLVPVSIPDNLSKFQHREELVYLPPAWFGSNPAPQLPTVMMIGPALNTPADWVRAGQAAHIIDDFAVTHGGNAPVAVFVDATGAFDNDTECVNGSRGNAADHLSKDVVPYMISNFRVSANRANWGVVGWSMGGTCAVDLGVMHPDMFSAFVDIAGDAAPNMGNKAQTIAALFGGDADAYAAFDPSTAITKYGRYESVYGWFDVPDSSQPKQRAITGAQIGTAGKSTGDSVANPEGQDVAANALCALGNAHGIQCSVVTQPGKHDWPFATQAFATALPWLAGRLGTPGISRLPLPGLTFDAPPTPVVAALSAPAVRK